jgi:hypothetical protein
MAWALSAQTPSSPKPKGSIRGIVRDAATGMPLVDATVQVWRIAAIKGGTIQQTSDTEKASTDGGGHYRVPAVLTGDIMVSVGADGHDGVTRKVNLDTDTDLTVDFELPPAPTISGHVFDENKEPAHALVWLIATGYRSGLLLRRQIGPQITDDKGYFSFDSGVEAGRSYYLLAERPLTKRRVGEREEVERSTYYGDAASLTAATPITLRPGQRQMADIKIRKAKPYCVDGIVKAAGEPVYMSMSIREASLAGVSVTSFDVESSDDGTFHVCGLPPGEYSLVPVRSIRNGLTHFTIADSDLNDVQLNLDFANLYLDLSWDGDSPSEQHPSLLPPLSVGFHTTILADGTRQAERTEYRTWPEMADGGEVAILLSSADVPRAQKSETAPYRGPFGSDLNPGDYAVDVRVAAGSYVKELTYGGVPVTDGTLSLVAGVNGTLRVVAAQGAATVTAKVTDADGKPLPDTNMVLIPDRVASAEQFSALARQGFSDAGGTITWGSLVPGKYHILALTRLYKATQEDLDKVLAALPKALIVELDPKSNAQVTVQPVSID